MSESANKRNLLRIVPTLCLSTLFQFAACAQAASENNATKNENSAVTTAGRLIEKPDFDFTALSDEMLCSPQSMFGLPEVFAQTNAQQPKIQLPQPKQEISVQPHAQQLNKVSFSTPEKLNPHAPRNFRATAYALHGITRSGVRTRPGTLAADPRVLPLGTVVQVQAGKYSGVYTVHDTGKAIKGNIVDVGLPTTKEARRFGRRNVKLVVLRYPNQKSKKVAPPAVGKNETQTNLQN